MRMRFVSFGVRGMVCLGLLLPGCQTTGDGAMLGAGLGAALGAAIGGQNGNAAEGALIGAAAGAAFGAVASEVRQQRIANRAQVEAEYRQAGKPVPSTPVAQMESIAMASNALQPGDTLHVQGQYLVLNAPTGSQPAGMLHLKKNGRTVQSTPFTPDRECRGLVDMQMPLPQDLSPGTYTVEFAVQNGNAVSAQEATFELA